MLVQLHTSQIAKAKFLPLTFDTAHQLPLSSDVETQLHSESWGPMQKCCLILIFIHSSNQCFSTGGTRTPSVSLNRAEGSYDFYVNLKPISYACFLNKTVVS